jgi:hypothetical protein
MAPLAAMLSNKPVEVHRGILGQVTPGPGATGINQMLSSSFLLTLPDKPVRVGDSWETAVKAQGQLGLGGGFAPNLPDVELKLTYTLKSLEDKGGHTLAVIETKGKSGAGDAGAGEGGQNYTGTTRFDVTAGGVQSAKYIADVKLKMNLGGLLGGAPGGAAPPPGGVKPEGLPGSMQIDGTMSFDLAEVPLAPAKSPAKKPVAKKAVRKPLSRK